MSKAPAYGLVTTVRFTEAQDRWLKDQAKKQEISRNEIVSRLVNKAMEEKP